jgi:hypothetical protein
VEGPVGAGEAVLDVGPPEGAGDRSKGRRPGSHEAEPGAHLGRAPEGVLKGRRCRRGRARPGTVRSIQHAAAARRGDPRTGRAPARAARPPGRRRAAELVQADRHALQKTLRVEPATMREERRTGRVWAGALSSSSMNEVEQHEGAHPPQVSPGTDASQNIRCHRQWRVASPACRTARHRPPLRHRVRPAGQSRGRRRRGLQKSPVPVRRARAAGGNAMTCLHRVHGATSDATYVAFLYIIVLKNRRYASIYDIEWYDR